MTQFDRTRFAGRRALVTGASRGIGAGIAERLAVTPSTSASHSALSRRMYREQPE